ncbi:MAG: hypothetical protein HQK60_03305 [Deltaproteobacteria bacterium]|nr:hypothetical protein [Deltaproteobacteria bacterium]
MSRLNIDFSHEHEMDSPYKGEKIGICLVDFFVEGRGRCSAAAFLATRFHPWKSSCRAFMRF